MSEVFLVLGMHRSGTSSVAGVLNMLGATGPKNMIPANTGNERGYWESWPIYRFNNDLLSWAGSSWSDWRKFSPSASKEPGIRVFRERAKRLFETEFEGRPLAVLKDPRICRFAPFWLDVLAEMKAKPLIVIPLRSPLEVARSLNARDGLPLMKGLLLWLRHTLDAEAATRSLPRVIISWDEFLADWRRAAEEISTGLGVSWPQLSDRTCLEIDRFLSATLKHHTIGDAELSQHSDVHTWTLQAYEAMLILVREPDSNGPRAVLDEIRALFEQSCEVFGQMMLDHEIENTRLRARARSLQAERDHWLAHCQRIESALDQRRAEEGQTTPDRAQRTEDDGRLRALVEGGVSRKLAAAWDRTGLQALRDALRALDANPVLPPHTPLCIFSGDILEVDLRDRFAQELFVFKSVEPDITEFVIRALRKGQVAYDVGAHVGYYAVLMAGAVGPDGRVLAFEPTPATCTLLRQSVARFPNVDVHEVAVGDRDGEVDLMDFGPTLAAFNSVWGLCDFDHGAREAAARRLQVLQTTLDEMSERTGFAPDLIKIDVEGAESNVLAGMERLLATVRPTIVLELNDFFHFQEAGALSGREIIDFMGLYGYRPYEFKGDRLVPHKVPKGGSYACTNVIFLPLEDEKLGWDLK